MASENEKKKQKKQKQKMEEKNNNRKGKGNEKKPAPINDERFASAQSDPRFMEAPRKHTKVEIDSRFSRIFTDKSFASSNAPIDKRGRPVDAKSKAASLKHYYRIENKQEQKADRSKEDDFEEESDESESESEKLKEVEDDFDEQTSDDETSFASHTDSSEDEEQVEEEEDADTFFQPENVPGIDKETRRLAVVNLDWGQVRAVDLYVLLSSFLPKGGQIISVAVYPSEFGLKRMEEEAVRGPVGLFEDDEDGLDDDEEDDETVKKKIRAYELSRLR